MEKEIEEGNVMKVVDKQFTTKEAIAEAKRCLNCKKPTCVTGCPIGNRIPDFIHQLSLGNVGAAMTIINENSNLPAICGRVCPHENQCQGHCILNKRGMPIQIGKLETFIADFDTEMNLTREKLPQKTHGKVAVVGSGPAGLTVAGDLARKGFNVTIYERESEPGGVLTYGIPEHRLPLAVVRHEIKKIEELGVNFVVNSSVGDCIKIDELFAEGYDAIFLGTGTALPKEMPGVPGVDLQGIVQSSHFLHCVSAYTQGVLTRDMVPITAGDRIGVIGGGNVAIDAARTAIRFGADVTVIYRRTHEEMPAIEREYAEAVEEGVKFYWKTTVPEFIGDENHKLKEVRLASPDGERIEQFDRIYIAIGSRPASRIVSNAKGIETDENGYVIVKDRPACMSTRPGVFAAGDVVHRPQTVVMAMKAAKEAAKGIAQYVDAIKLMEDIGMLKDSKVGTNEQDPV